MLLARASTTPTKSPLSKSALPCAAMPTTLQKAAVACACTVVAVEHELERAAKGNVVSAVRAGSFVQHARSTATNSALQLSRSEQAQRGDGWWWCVREKGTEFGRRFRPTFLLLGQSPHTREVAGMHVTESVDLTHAVRGSQSATAMGGPDTRWRSAGVCVRPTNHAHHRTTSYSGITLHRTPESGGCSEPGTSDTAHKYTHSSYKRASAPGRSTRRRRRALNSARAQLSDRRTTAAATHSDSHQPAN